jgi:hypothetical protein
MTVVVAETGVLRGRMYAKGGLRHGHAAALPRRRRVQVTMTFHKDSGWPRLGVGKLMRVGRPDGWAARTRREDDAE